MRRVIKTHEKQEKKNHGRKNAIFFIIITGVCSTLANGWVFNNNKKKCAELSTCSIRGKVVDRPKFKFHFKKTQKSIYYF